MNNVHLRDDGAERDGAESSDCEVVVLVPHRSTSEMLICPPSEAAPDQTLRLPSVAMGPEPPTTEITRTIGELLGCSVTLLRANTMSWQDNFDAATMVVEVDAVTSVINEQFRWQVVDETGVESLSPEWARASVRSWLGERTSGWSDLRPQWSRPGWMAQAGTWMKEQMQLAGYVAPQDPQIHQVWGVSIVLSAHSSSGTAYLKCSGERFRTEPLVTRALAERAPTLLPEVIAVDPERGWMVMRDLAGPLLADQPKATWALGLDALQTLQHQWLGATEELLSLGVESRPLADLAPWVESITSDADLMDRLTSEEQQAWSAAQPVMVKSCWRLDRTEPGPTLVHGDFHPENAVLAREGVRIFDWTDASVTHPFLDLVTYVMRTDDLKVRHNLMHRYLTQWDRQLAGDELAELGRLALVVGALHQAHTYVQLIPTVMPDDLAQLRDGDVGWIRRAMRFADEGLIAKY